MRKKKEEEEGEKCRFIYSLCTCSEVSVNFVTRAAHSRRMYSFGRHFLDIWQLKISFDSLKFHLVFLRPPPNQHICKSSFVKRACGFLKGPQFCSSRWAINLNQFEINAACKSWACYKNFIAVFIVWCMCDHACQVGFAIIYLVWSIQILGNSVLEFCMSLLLMQSLLMLCKGKILTWPFHHMVFFWSY